MAQGKYSRVDGKKSSSCSMTTVVVVIGVCLVGVWMFMSSPVFPGQSPSLPPAQDSMTDLKAKVSMNPSSQFEDNSGDVPEDAIKDGVNQETIQDEPATTNVGNGDEKSNDEEPPTSRNEESTTKYVETNTEDNSISSQYEKAKSKSDDSNSDTNETEISDSKVKKEEKKPEDDKKPESFPDAGQSEILKETRIENGAFSTQAAESSSEKDSKKQENGYKWKTCNVTTGADFIPCLDNIGALRKIHHTSHYEHRERHCPDESPTCLVRLPKGYKIPVTWPRSRDQVQV